MPQPSDILLMDHWLGKAGVQLVAGVRAALVREKKPPITSSGGIGSPGLGPWSAMFKSPLLTEVWAMEEEDCRGRSGYYNTAGALRDMVVTHLTLAASAALQPPLGLHSSRLTPASRAGVLASLFHPSPTTTTTTRSSILAFARYRNASEEHGIRTHTAVAAVLHLRQQQQLLQQQQQQQRVTFWTGKGLGLRSSGVRQLLSLSGEGGVGAVSESKSRAKCGPLSITFHIQGTLLPPFTPSQVHHTGNSKDNSSKDNLLASLNLPLTPNSPAVLITGLCGSVAKALGDPGARLVGGLQQEEQGESRTGGGGGGVDGGFPAGGKWEIRQNSEKGLWGAVFVSPPTTLDMSLRKWGGSSTDAGAAGGLWETRMGLQESLGMVEKEEEDADGSPLGLGLGRKICENLARVAKRLGLAGGDAYTTSIAAALSSVTTGGSVKVCGEGWERERGGRDGGAGERFLSPDETERLWSLWDAALGESDAWDSSKNKNEGGEEGADFYDLGSVPAWMKFNQVGATLPQKMGGGFTFGETLGEEL